MVLINILILALVSLAASESPVFEPSFNRDLQAFDKFQTSPRRGPHDYFGPNSNNVRPTSIYGPLNDYHHGGTHNGHNQNEINHNSHTQDAFFPPNHPPPDAYGAPLSHDHFDANGHPAYNYKPAPFFHTGEARLEKPLFSPSNGLEFAATNGQIDNFNKALQEEAQQFLHGSGHNQRVEEPFSNLDGPRHRPKTYVSVKFGQPNHQYQYEI